MALLETILDEIVLAIDGISTPIYPLGVAQVDAYDINLVNAQPEAFPNVSVIDNGSSELRVENDDTSERWSMELLVRVAVRTDTMADVLPRLSRVEASVLQLIKSAPALTRVLQWKTLGILERAYVPLASNRNYGYSIIQTRVTYYVTGSSF